MSTLKVGAVRGVSASSDAITVANDGTCTANITNNLSNRNLIINGAMEVSQRGTSFSPTSNEYTVDRFEQAVGSSFTMDTTITQSTDTPATFKNSLKVTPDSTQTPTGSHNAVIAQHIEGQTLVPIGYGTSACKQITLSFYAKSSSQNNGQTYTVQISKRISGAQKYVTKTFDISSSWQRFTMTFPADTASATETDNTIGMNIFWHLASGPDDIVAESPNAWVSQNGYRAATGQDNFFDNTSNEFYLTGVQLEVGSVATDFEHRLFGQELALCQRYFFRYKNDAGDHGHFVCATSYGSTDQRAGAFNFPTTMRTSPSFSHSGTGNFALLGLGSSITNILIADVGTSVSGCGLRVQTSGTLSDGQSTNLRANNTTNAHFDFDSEL